MLDTLFAGLSFIFWKQQHTQTLQTLVKKYGGTILPPTAPLASAPSNAANVYVVCADNASLESVAERLKALSGTISDEISVSRPGMPAITIPLPTPRVELVTSLWASKSIAATKQLPLEDFRPACWPLIKAALQKRQRHQENSSTSREESDIDTVPFSADEMVNREESDTDTVPFSADQMVNVMTGVADVEAHSSLSPPPQQAPECSHDELNLHAPESIHAGSGVAGTLENRAPKDEDIEMEKDERKQEPGPLCTAVRRQGAQWVPMGGHLPR
jgi:hypothetical protein